MTSYLIEADGGSRGNPGPAGYGAVVMDASDGQVLAEAAEAIGVTTNNVAEYRGLIAGLRAVLELAGDGAQVAVRMDSKLVVEQMAGRWKIKNEGLRPLALEAAKLARRLRVTEWTWIPRARNQHADRLANEAMDAAAKGLTWQAGGSAVPRETPTSTPFGPGADVRDEPTGHDARAQREARDLGEQRMAGGSSEQRTASRSAAQRAVSDSGVGTAVSGPAAPFLVEQTDLLDAGDIPDLSAPAASVAAAQQRTTGTGWSPPTQVATSLILLRHGETPLSAERRFSGLGDPDLTLNGLAQAAAAAEKLSRDPYRPDVIIASPRTRARQTAQAVAARTGLDYEVDEDLRETDFGAWEGHTFTEVQRRWPTELAAWLTDPDTPPPGGESFTAVAHRVERAQQRLKDTYEGRTILVVSHVTPIKTLLRLALLAPPAALYRMHLDLACLSLIEHYADGQSVVKTFNDTSHLR